MLFHTWIATSCNISHINRQIKLYVDPRPVCSAPKSRPLVSPSLLCTLKAQAEMVGHLFYTFFFSEKCLEECSGDFQ